MLQRDNVWLKIGNDFELLDTPGILWPKFESEEVGNKLALTGAIKDALLHMDDYCINFWKLLVSSNWIIQSI